MRKIVVLFVFFMCASFLFADKVAEFPDLMRPFSMAIDGDEIYIIENRKKISVYSLSNFQVLREISKLGEGPGEFKRNPDLRFFPDSESVFMGARTKVMIFSKMGKLIDEKRIIPLSRVLPAENNYVTVRNKNEGERNFITVDLLNSDLKKTKQLYEQERLPRRGSISPIRDYLGFDTYEDKIFIAEGRKGFFIEVFNSNGKKLYDVEKKLERIKITNEFKKIYIEQLVQQPGGGEWKFALERFKLEYPKYFPEIRSFRVIGGKIFVETYKRIKEEIEFIILDLRGNELKRVFLPLFDEGSLVEKHVYTFTKDSYYYLKYDDDSESWVLHRINL